MLSCRSAHQNSTFDYFKCLENKDREYIEKTDTLNKRVNTCVIKAEDCLDRCKASFEASDDKLADCNKKCEAELYECSKTISYKFYEELLKANKEWNKVRNVIND